MDSGRRKNAEDPRINVDRPLRRVNLVDRRWNADRRIQMQELIEQIDEINHKLSPSQIANWSRAHRDELVQYREMLRRKRDEIRTGAVEGAVL